MGRQILHEFYVDYAPDEGAIDMARLRLAVAELMERGAKAVQMDGLEQDDAELERWAVMGFAGDGWASEVSIESLTDRERLVEPILARAADARGRISQRGGVEIRGLAVRVVVDPEAPFARTPVK